MRVTAGIFPVVTSEDDRVTVAVTPRRRSATSLLMQNRKAREKRLRGQSPRNVYGSVRLTIWKDGSVR